MKVVTWIALHVVDERTGRPLVREPFTIVSSDGERRSGILDEDGRVRLDSIVAGECDLELPDLDGREWGRPGADPTEGELLELVPERRHRMARGDHLGAVAHRAGFRSALTVWNHPANERLRAARTSMHVLAPGDEVIVPPRTRRIEVGGTSTTHELVARALPLSIAVRALDPWRRAMSGADAEFLGFAQATTDGDGQIDRALRPTERTAHARVADLGAQLAIGGLIPVEEGAGLRARLLNLGYLVGFAWTEVDEDELAFAIADFQADEGLSITYAADGPTRTRLVAVHGS